MTDALLTGDLPLPPRPDYLSHGITLKSWLITTDHKRIAILYAITITIFFFMGGIGITLKSWLITTDHKRIAILYAITITIFFFMGGIAITLVRLELVVPNGWLLTSDT